jgi:hypothetical protein
MRRGFGFLSTSQSKRIERRSSCLMFALASEMLPFVLAEENENLLCGLFDLSWHGDHVLCFSSTGSAMNSMPANLTS